VVIREEPRAELVAPIHRLALPGDFPILEEHGKGAVDLAAGAAVFVAASGSAVDAAELDHLPGVRKLFDQPSLFL
jgi:hypothetical protein